jgi:hypothetical protein
MCEGFAPKAASPTPSALDNQAQSPAFWAPLEFFCISALKYTAPGPASWHYTPNA